MSSQFLHFGGISPKSQRNWNGCKAGIQWESAAYQAFAFSNFFIWFYLFIYVHGLTEDQPLHISVKLQLYSRL